MRQQTDNYRMFYKRTMIKTSIFMIFLAINAVFPQIASITGPYTHEVIAKSVSRLEAKIPKYDMSVMGKASWYGKPFHGRLTANGEIYDMHTLTAAHKTLPFGTWLRLTNSRTGQIATVRVNDRGPYIRGRDLDVSFAAATKLGLVAPGSGPLNIEVLAGAPPSAVAPAPGRIMADAIKPTELAPRVALRQRRVLVRGQ
jgi:rare lipoprotein A (peptidoglycan hydrolase)